MKKFKLFCLALCCVLGLTSCSKDDGNTLYLYNWTYYTPDSVLKAFEPFQPSCFRLQQGF